MISTMTSGSNTWARRYNIGLYHNACRLITMTNLFINDMNYINTLSIQEPYEALELSLELT
jgi:hypothetical protein